MLRAFKFKTPVGYLEIAEDEGGGLLARVGVQGESLSVELKPTHVTQLRDALVTIRPLPLPKDGPK